MRDKTTQPNRIFPECRPITEDTELNEPTLGLQAQDLASFQSDTGKASELEDAVDDVPEVTMKASSGTVQKEQVSSSRASATGLVLLWSSATLVNGKP
jgi:hypothetical protein